MAKIDEIYKDLVNTIIDEGEMESGDVRPKYADGTPAYTKRIYGVNLKLKAGEGLPILQSKKVAMKSFKAEIDWIFRLMSNDVNVLNELGSKVWDSWTHPPTYYVKNRDLVEVKHIKFDDFGEPNLIYDIDFDETEENVGLKLHWERMMTRCYNKNSDRYRFYGEKGIQVHPDWWDVNNFIKDAKKLLNYSYKKDNWNDFQLDKDYYSSNTYSKETCMWIPHNENVLYTDHVKYAIRVIAPNGYVKEFLSSAEVSDKYNISGSTLHRFLQTEGKLGMKYSLKGKNKRFNRWEFAKIYPKEGHSFRLSLINKTIGNAYGNQLKHKIRTNNNMNQVEFIIDQIKNNPRSRRIMTNLYDVDDLDTMALEPCVFMTNWQVDDNNKLHLVMTQRSADVALKLAPSI